MFHVRDYSFYSYCSSASIHVSHLRVQSSISDHGGIILHRPLGAVVVGMERTRKCSQPKSISTPRFGSIVLRARPASTTQDVFLSQVAVERESRMISQTGSRCFRPSSQCELTMRCFRWPVAMYRNSHGQRRIHSQLTDRPEQFRPGIIIILE